MITNIIINKATNLMSYRHEQLCFRMQHDLNPYPCGCHPTMLRALAILHKLSLDRYQLSYITLTVT